MCHTAFSKRAASFQKIKKKIEKSHNHNHLSFHSINMSFWCFLNQERHGFFGLASLAISQNMNLNLNLPDTPNTSLQSITWRTV